MFVEEPFYFKAFHFVGIALDKYNRRVGWEKSPKGVLGWGWCQFQLGHRKDWVNPSIGWYIEFVGQVTYLFHNTEGADVLLGQLLGNSSRCGDALSLVQS